MMRCSCRTEHLGSITGPLHENLLSLSTEEIRSIQERVTRSFSNEGISFTVYGDEEGEERIIPVDCVPRVISADEWRFLEKGLAQRVKAAKSLPGRRLQRSPYP